MPHLEKKSWTFSEWGTAARSIRALKTEVRSGSLGEKPESDPDLQISEA